MCVCVDWIGLYQFLKIKSKILFDPLKNSWFFKFGICLVFNISNWFFSIFVRLDIFYGTKTMSVLQPIGSETNLAHYVWLSLPQVNFAHGAN